MRFNPLALLGNLSNPFKRKELVSQALAPVPGSGGQKRIQHRLKDQKYYQADLDLDDLANAIMLAEAVESPDRREYYSIVDTCIGDPRLQATLRQANLDVISEPWVIVHKKTRKVVKDLGRLLQRKWWEEYNKNLLDTEWFGHTLQEAGALKIGPSGKLEISGMNLIPRKLVIPETGLLRVSDFSDVRIPFREEPFNTWLIECGDERDLGLMKYLAKSIIYKRFAMSDWSRSSEKWADPILIIRSASNDDEENDKKAEFARNFGKNSWAMFDEADEVELLERKQSDSYKIYFEFLAFINSEIAEAVNGQAGTTEQKAFVGAAEVQERVMQAFSLARLRGLYYFHQEVTFPFLAACNEGDTAYADFADHEWIPLRILRAETEQNTTGEDPNGQPDPRKNGSQQQGGQKGNPAKKPAPEALLSDLLSR